MQSPTAGGPPRGLDGYATEAQLRELVRAHYDTPVLRQLAGEIHFDDALSDAEMQVAAQVLAERSGSPLGPDLFLPCAGTLRHVPPLLKLGCKRIVAVDLSLESLEAGRARYGEGFPAEVEIYHGDVRAAVALAPEGGFRHAILMANTLGDITTVEGHLAFIEALARSLADDGAMVFDYVADRYNPPPRELQTTEWNEVLVAGGKRETVVDRRTRRLVAAEGGLSVLECSCEIIGSDGAVLDRHDYRRLTVPDELLQEHFARCGLSLETVGSMVALSPYHRRRVETTNDLGMMGAPSRVYVARPAARSRAGRPTGRAAR